MGESIKINEFVSSFMGKAKVITEESAKQILEKYGIRVPDHALVSNANEAEESARRIGFPIVAKIVSEDILHKTDVGGVKVGLNSVEEVKTTFEEMYNRLKE